MIPYSEIQTIKNKTERLKAQLEISRRDLNRKRVALSAQKRHHKDILKARILIQTAATETQKNLGFHISNLVTSALFSVFPDPYEFRVKFVERRNSTECDMFFYRDGNFYFPEFASGGGALDVSAFSSRISQQTLEKTRPVIILDEPFKYLSHNLIPNACDMLTALKNELKIQFIIITHISQLSKAADKVFQVEQGKIWTSKKS